MLSLNKADFMAWKSLVLANACAIRDRLDFISLTNNAGFVVYGFQRKYIFSSIYSLWISLCSLRFQPCALTELRCILNKIFLFFSLLHFIELF